jgi:hypothetical protein
MSTVAFPTVYRGLEYRSRLEARWAAFFDQIRWDFTYEPFDGNGCIPDWLEVAGSRPARPQDGGLDGSQVVVVAIVVMSTGAADQIAGDVDTDPAADRAGVPERQTGSPRMPVAICPERSGHRPVQLTDPSGARLRLPTGRPKRGDDRE